MRLPVVVEVDADQRPLECESVDVSLGGVRLRSSAPVPEGPVVVVLTVHDDALLVAFGDVLDVSDGEARVRFQAMRPGARGRLARLLAGVDREPGSPQSA